MPGDEIKIGPFVGGLNTSSDPTSIGDLELSVCDNFDVNLDGTLTNRPPIVNLSVSMTLGITGNMKILGWFTTTAGASTLIGSDGLNTTYYFNGTAWVTITNTVAACAVVQYADKAYLLAPPGSANPGGAWSIATGFSAIATMPKGKTIAVQKERLWIGPGSNVTSNGSHVYYCAIGDPSTWAGDFVTIGNGDGQNVLEIVVYFQDLLIFKNDSTYRLSYDIDISLATISCISNTIGIFETGCTTTYENRIFVLHNNSLYELSNYNYSCINTKVPFKATNASISLSELAGISYYANRLFVSFYDTTYVWSIRTGTWATWSSATFNNMAKVYPLPSAQAVSPQAYTYSRTPRSASLYKIVDEVGAGAETMVCTVSTKNYDFDTTSRYKRLFYWEADCIAKSRVTGTATPVQYASTVTWGALAAYTWGQVGISTWGRLSGEVSGTDIVAQRIDIAETSGLTGERKLIKLGDRSLRFRQIGFKIEMGTDGSSSTAPVRLFKLVTWVKTKQSVSGRIS